MALADLANLRQLNLSSNPALSGSLPALWAAIPHMQLLDVSGCTLSGSLPAEFAAWQELRELAAAGNRALGGQLPGSWGLMQSLQVRLVCHQAQLNILCWHAVLPALTGTDCMP